MSHARGPSTSASRTRSRSPVALSRPTTPLRPSSRTSFRASSSASAHARGGSGGSDQNALDALEPQFAELADSMADLEANMMHLQLMHESLARFGESFAGFLYGLNMNAFVVDFPEAPDREGIKRWGREQRRRAREMEGGGGDETVMTAGGRAGDETTLATGDTSYASMKATPRRKSVAPLGTPGTTSTSASLGAKSGIPSARGGAAARGGRASGRGGRASALPRGSGGRGVK